MPSEKEKNPLWRTLSRALEKIKAESSILRLKASIDSRLSEPRLGFHSPLQPRRNYHQETEETLEDEEEEEEEERSKRSLISQSLGRASPCLSNFSSFFRSSCNAVISRPSFQLEHTGEV